MGVPVPGFTATMPPRITGKLMSRIKMMSPAMQTAPKLYRYPSPIWRVWSNPRNASGIGENAAMT